jgi:hypothetical protein
MKMPTQAIAVERTVTPTKITGRIVPSGICEMLCNRLPEPARSICLAAC